MHRFVPAGKLLLTMAMAALLFAFNEQSSQAELPIADIKHDGAVDFQKEILPILRRNCLACHNATDAESDLVLETPQTILEGGSEGPSVVAGKSGESLLFKLSSHADDPVMPPEDNDVGAKNLTPEQLGLLKLWIEQGAKGEVSNIAGPIQWQPLPATINPVYSLAVSPHGKYVAAGRSNQIFIYKTANKSLATRLTDAALLEQGVYKNPGVAHLDIVQSLAFSPDGNWLASGGYRTVKIWQRPQNPQSGKLEGIEGEPQSLAVSPDGKWAAVGEASGKVKVIDLSTGKVAKTLQGHTAAVSGVAFSSDSAQIATGSQDKTFRVYQVADGKEVGNVETPAPVNAVAFVLENKQVATGHADNKLMTWHLPGTEPAPAEGEQPAEGEAEPQGPQPIKEFAGHGGPITSLLAVKDGTQLLSGSADSTMRHWDASGGNQIRQFSPGGPVASVAASSDGTKFAAACTNNVAKIFRADNGQQLAEVRGDHRNRLAQDDANQALALAKRHVDNAKKDLEEANKRKKSEEDNAKKADENLKKTEGEKKTKEEAAKKPVEEKKQADEALAAATPLKEQAEAEKTKAEEAATKAAELQTAEQKKRDDANKVAADAQNVVNAANQKLQQAQAAAKAAQDKVTSAENAAKAAGDKVTAAQNSAKAAAEKLTTAQATAKAAADKLAAAQKAAQDKADDQNLTNAAKAAEGEKAKADEAVKVAEAENTAANTALKTAEAEKVKADEAVKVAQAEKTKTDDALKVVEKEKADADAALAKANEAKAAAEKVYQEAVAANQVAQKAKTDATNKFNDLNNKFNQAMNVVKQKAGPAQKATDELNAATRAYEAAMRSVERSKESVAKATAAVPMFEATQKQREEEHAQRQKEKEEADKAVPTGDKPILAVAFSADGTTLVTGGEDGLVHLWSAENGQPIEVYEGQGGPVTALACAVTTTGVIALGKNSSGIVWDTAPDWKLVRTIGSPDSSEQFIDRVTALHFSPDSQLLATGGGEPSRSGELKIWKVADGSLVREIKDAHSDTLFDLEFSPDGTMIASCASDRFAKVHAVADGKFVRAFEGHTHHVMGVSWRADGRMLATSGADKVVKVWNAQTGDQTRTITGWKKEVTAIKFVSTGDEMITAAGDPQVSMRDTNGGNRGGFSGPNDFVYTVRASADGKTFASGGESGIVRVWNAQKQPVASFEPPEPEAEEPSADKQAAN